jgi:hypothetical protein
MKFAEKVLLAFIFFASCATLLHAQTIQIKLINGKTGRALTGHTPLNVWVGHVRQFPIILTTDWHGVALLRLSDKDNEINVPECKDEDADYQKLNPKNKSEVKDFNKKYKGCREYGDNNATFRYADSFTVMTLGGNSLPYVPCWVDSNNHDYTWLNQEHFNTVDVLQHGVTTENICSKATASPVPGELILFVRPLTFRESWRATFLS